MNAVELAHLLAARMYDMAHDLNTRAAEITAIANDLDGAA